MGRLKSLQVLSNFVVGKNSGSTIEELGKLPMLRGKLFLSRLKNVSAGRDAYMANMKGKKHLEKLTLKWNGDTNESQVAKDVLNKLQPRSNLKRLKIDGYCRTSFQIG